MTKNKDPWWVQRAKHLRSTGWTVEEISDELLRPPEVVRGALKLGPKVREEFRPSSARKVVVAGQTPVCDTCGKPLGKEAKYATCPSCRGEAFTRRIERCVELWNSGMTAREVSVEMGERLTQATGLIIIARERGMDVQDRRRPKKKKG